MTLVAQRMNTIQPSATLAMTGRVHALQEAGKRVIGLSAGEPDFPTPEYICEAAIRAIRGGQTRYTDVGGTSTLKAAVAEKFYRENGLTYNPDQIIVSCGGKQVLYNAFMASLDPGDEVIIPAPFWVSYADMVLLAGGRPVLVPCSEAVGFKLHPGDLLQAISPRTKWLVLNSPSNPTGAAYNEMELRALADVLLRYSNIHILSDDIYEHIRYNGRPFHTIAQVEPGLHARTLTMNGVSKAYAMTGWRIGYAGGPKALISAMVKIQGQSTSNPCSISQAAAVAALTGDQSFLIQRARVFQTRRDLTVRALNSIKGLTCRTPEGAFYVYPSCAGVIGKRTPGGKTLETDEDFVTYLLENNSVACVHGKAFGMSPYFRISYATTTEALQEALERIQSACQALR